VFTIGAVPLPFNKTGCPANCLILLGQVALQAKQWT